MSITTTPIAVLSAKLDNGAELPLREQKSKFGNTYWAALDRKKDGSRYFNRYGVQVSGAVIGGALPKLGSKVTILGTSFVFGEKVDKESKAVLDGRVEATGTMTVPGHGKKQVQVLIRDLGDNRFNLVAKVMGISSGKRNPLDEL